MGVEAFIKGIIIGLLASLPLGPVAILCIQRTLSKSHRSGFVSGLGAATADTIFAATALFFLTFIMSLIQSYMEVIKVLGGIAVILVGMTIFLKNPVIQIRLNRAGKGSNLWSDYFSMFLITLANPFFILIFVALFAAFGVSSGVIGYSDGIVMIVGVLCGAATWWFTLTLGVSFLRKKFRPRHLLWMNRISGAVIVVLGAIAIVSAFIKTLSVDGILYK